MCVCVCVCVCNYICMYLYVITKVQSSLAIMPLMAHNSFSLFYVITLLGHYPSQFNPQSAHILRLYVLLFTT